MAFASPRSSALNSSEPGIGLSAACATSFVSSPAMAPRSADFSVRSVSVVGASTVSAGAADSASLPPPVSMPPPGAIWWMRRSSRPAPLNVCLIEGCGIWIFILRCRTTIPARPECRLLSSGLLLQRVRVPCGGTSRRRRAVCRSIRRRLVRILRKLSGTA